MGQQIIRQPDGLFAIFSTNTDTIIVWDATAQDVFDHFIERATADVKRQVAEILVNVAAGEPRKSYYQFAMTWDEALASDEAHGGEAWQDVATRTETP